MFSAGFPGWCKSNLSIRLVPWRSRTMVTLSPKLFAVTSVAPSAVTAIAHQKKAAFPALAKSFGTEEHCHGAVPDRRQMRGGVDHQRAGRRNGPPLAGRVLLAQSAGTKSQTNQKENTALGT